MPLSPHVHSLPHYQHPPPDTICILKIFFLASICIEPYFSTQSIQSFLEYLEAVTLSSSSRPKLLHSFLILDT